MECLHALVQAGGETKLGEDQRPARCLEEWEDAYDFWNSQQEVL